MEIATEFNKSAGNFVASAFTYSLPVQLSYFFDKTSGLPTGAAQKYDKWLGFYIFTPYPSQLPTL